MPTVDELRAWLQGDIVEGLPEREEPGALSIGQDQRDCPKCEGEGAYQGGICPMCHGQGSAQRDEPRPAFADRMRDKVAAKKRGGKYAISPDKTDARLLFGKHKDVSLGELSKSRDGRGYLEWMMKEDFPEELKKMAHKWHNFGVEKYEHGGLSKRGLKI